MSSAPKRGSAEHLNAIVEHTERHGGRRNSDGERMTRDEIKRDAIRNLERQDNIRNRRS